MKYYICSSGIAVFEVSKGGFRQYFHNGMVFTSTGFNTDIPWVDSVGRSYEEITKAKFDALLGLWSRTYREI
jgi:hypothetical protein